jgi:hypothetical protein
MVAVCVMCLCVETRAPFNRLAPGIIHHYTCHYHPPISSIIIGDYKLMRHLNTGEMKLFNIKTDYSEQENLAGTMPERVDVDGHDPNVTMSKTLMAAQPLRCVMRSMISWTPLENERKRLTEKKSHYFESRTRQTSTRNKHNY